MKILHLVQRPQLRGAEVFTSQLSSHLNRLGHEAVIVCLFPGNAELPFNGKIYYLNGSLKKRLFDFKAWKQLANIIESEQPDIVQANAGDTLKYAVLSKLLFRWNVPVIFRNASTISLYIKSKGAKTYNNFFFKQAHKIISVSNTSGSDFAQLYPAYKDRIVTIPIGIEISGQNGNHDLKLNKSTVNTKPVLLHVGGFTYEKNHVGLISIFRKLLEKVPHASLHLVGNGPLKTQMEELVKENNLTDKVVFHGYQPNAMDFMMKADVLVLPSIIEGLPGVILEAFYCKTPVVAYNVGGISEILMNKKTGRIIAKGSEDEFANAIYDSLKQNEENNQMVENAYQLATSEYLNTTIAEKFVQTYSSIVS